jgi:hypothetical protein
MSNKFSITLSAAAIIAITTLVVAPSLAADQDKPAGSATVSSTHTATVMKIDSQDRWVTLKMADGSLVDIQAGPAVKNFAQIKVGDKVTATQQDTVTIEVVPAGQAAPNVTSGSATVTAPAGSKPMGVKVDTTVVSGTVSAIDYGKRLVTLTGPDGNSHTFEVGAGAKKFKNVKKGDVVVLTLKTATAIEVLPAGK